MTIFSRSWDINKGACLNKGKGCVLSDTMHGRESFTAMTNDQ